MNTANTTKNTTRKPKGYTDALKATEMANAHLAKKGQQDSGPIQIDRGLAMSIGLIEVLVLAQVEKWAREPINARDSETDEWIAQEAPTEQWIELDRCDIYGRPTGWRKALPYLNRIEVQAAINNLVLMGVLVTQDGAYLKEYRIDYVALTKIVRAAAKHMRNRWFCVNSVPEDLEKGQLESNPEVVA